MNKKSVAPADRGVRVEVPEEVEPLPVNDATAGDEGVDDTSSVSRRRDFENGRDGEVDEPSTR